MSFYRHGDGLFWSSLFSIEGRMGQLLEDLSRHLPDYTAQKLATAMLGSREMRSSYLKETDPLVQSACERVAIKFMLHDCELAEKLLDEEELDKANELFARKQYSAKLLKKLACILWRLLIDFSKINIQAEKIFIIPIVDEYRIAQEEEILRSFGALKKAMEDITSGVKRECYYQADQVFRREGAPLADQLNQLLIEKYGYDFNKAHSRKYDGRLSTLLFDSEEKINNSILQKALLNNEQFWAKHENFSVLTFLNEIAERNGIRHAQKVLLFIFDNLKKTGETDIVFKNRFPLYTCKYQLLRESLEYQAFRFSFMRLEAYCDLSPLKSVSLCCPMTKADPEHIGIGKRMWERFISEYNYPDNRDAVHRYISDEINRFISGDTHSDSDIAVILDSAPFRYYADSEDRRLFTAYHPDCFSYENIMNRVYLKAYAVTLLSDDDGTRFSYLQRIFVDLIKTIEKRTGICTSHQLDTASRDKHYQKLKEMLLSYGIEASDQSKRDYVISLLDRDTALMEEADRFPMLEQIGDSIYGLAVAELLFFNPDSLFYPKDSYDPNGYSIAERFEMFKRAEAQVLIAKKNKIDEMYLQVGLPAKFVEYDSAFFNFETLSKEQLGSLNQERYLADSLEMIIGAVSVDKGVTAALNFAKQLLKDAYPTHFTREIHLEDRNGSFKDIDREYWQRILPGLYSNMTQAHRVIWDALNKAVLTASIGTDDIEKRRFITNSFGNTAIYGEDITWPFNDYLHCGFDFVLKKYRDSVRRYYENKNN